MVLMEKTTSALLLVLGLYFTVQSVSLGLFSSGKPGVGFFPFLGGLILTIISCAQLIGTLKICKDTLEKPWSDKQGIRNIVLIVAFTALYIWTIGILGFLIPTIIYLLALVDLISEYSLKKKLIYSLASSFILFLIFAVLFAMPLPKGLLW
ncbi:tripartite tricarboxylate transporter TctB family protein [Neomoorella mulderi]|uniref:Tripartite tricarboxylate transporter TctB family protein n=1 Tax=Moorella mulderi DSM 14980 TaxID=1122241 RepID=A0A151ASQ2_9FIRM|nr:tripartite tricarboxylate transporter TctB family protein [Moorella mulderi]KYH30684.1 tripartite tricarboxylate transporter TctB family protein [Moorella mulderi DSM 14980]